MTARDVLALTLLVILLREAAEMEDDPWISGRDPGDESEPRPLQRECPRCRAVNVERTKEGLDPLPGHIKVRVRDGAIWCRTCDLALFPTVEAAA